MSYTMPGMRMYDTATDYPSGDIAMPAVPAASNGAPSGFLAGNNLSVGANYGFTLDATGAVILFLVLWFGTTGALHYLNK